MLEVDEDTATGQKILKIPGKKKLVKNNKSISRIQKITFKK